MSLAWTGWDAPAKSDDLWSWHDGRCASCGRNTSDLVTDHCHMTGLVRGLLCRSCNSCEGWQGDEKWGDWRSGKNPANAIKHFEIYVGRHDTPISFASALSYYTHSEKQQWFKDVVADLEAGDGWPDEAPWTEAATARKAIEDEGVRQVMESWSLLRPPAGDAA